MSNKESILELLGIKGKLSISAIARKLGKDRHYIRDLLLELKTKGLVIDWVEEKEYPTGSKVPHHYFALADQTKPPFALMAPGHRAGGDPVKR